MTPGTSTETAPVHPVLRRLSRTRRMRGITRFEAGGRSGSLEGVVEAGAPAPGVVVLHTEGSWRPTGAGAGMRVRDTVRWTALGDDRLRLEDQRGPEGARRLVELHPRDAATWVAEEPHRCGDDAYTPVLRVRFREVELAWTVRGPRKRGRVVKRFLPG